jgi:hypothetical protein
MESVFLFDSTYLLLLFHIICIILGVFYILLIVFTVDLWTLHKLQFNFYSSSTVYLEKGEGVISKMVLKKSHLNFIIHAIRGASAIFIVFFSVLFH